MVVLEQAADVAVKYIHGGGKREGGQEDGRMAEWFTGDFYLVGDWIGILRLWWIGFRLLCGGCSGPGFRARLVD